MRRRTAQGNMDHGVHLDREPVDSMAEKAVEKGWIAEIGVTAATLAVFGWIVFVIHEAMQGYQVLGPTFY